jgi:hypothetical protein
LARKSGATGFCQFDRAGIAVGTRIDTDQALLKCTLEGSRIYVLCVLGTFPGKGMRVPYQTGFNSMKRLDDIVITRGQRNLLSG